MIDLAGALLVLARRSLGPSRADWSAAMEIEFSFARADGRALAFAAGCLLAAWRELPQQEPGRFTILNHLWALGFLIPAAVYEFACVTRFPFLPIGDVRIFAALLPGSAQQLYFGPACNAAVPAMIASRLALGLLQLRLAWALVECDWASVTKLTALILSIAATLSIFTGVLLLGDPGIVQQATLLAAELTGIVLLARWHDRLPGLGA
ncbi:hypothetical protein HMF7854_12070 [Sphingomonas ginkgonis]|uniref:Uncharacterized protein n=1 Tax=Sphingomonas ginkgonis TaxID=2315330 RepID=A0A429VC40_9SPHN|nr:hypothetical protein [Sphingomonas ginkgonis]RST31493.1 hypothetical protein HMF7854_12070 [Sphingomonas ginkgonis]